MHNGWIHGQLSAAIAVFVVAVLAATPLRAQSDGRTQTRPAGATPEAAPTTPSPAPVRLRLRGEFRERMESTRNIGFSAGRDDAFWLSRLRITASLAPAPWMRVNAQVQDARVAGKDVGATGLPFSAPADIRIAHVEFGRTSSPVTITLGRQELVFGEQRLVGHVSWANAARTFDVVRATLRRPGVQVDLFAGSVVTIRTDGWDRGGLGNRFYGLYASTTRLVPHTVVEPYFFWRSDRNRQTETTSPGDLRLATGGVRLAGQVSNGVDLGSETVVQRGSLGTDRYRAFAQHLRLRSRPLNHGLRVASEYNYASGDRATADGRRGTFDPLYPTAHDKYGLADQVGWRNVHHLRLALEMPMPTGIPVVFAYHSWWLASRTDALYAASGAPLARIPAGAPSRHVGQGFDVSGARALTPQVSAAAGYAYIRAGGFLKAATPGTSLHAAYLMITCALTTEH